MEVVIKIEVKDNNVEQALRVLKRKLQRDGFFKVIKLKNTYEKPSEKKKRILQENIKRVKFYTPIERGYEREIKKRLQWWDKLRTKNEK